MNKLERLTEYKLERLTEAMDMKRLDAYINNLDITIEIITSLMKNGAVPSSDHLKVIWLAHEKLGEAYDLAEKVRAKK